MLIYINRGIELIYVSTGLDLIYVSTRFMFFYLSKYKVIKGGRFMRDTNISASEELVDIRDVTVNRELPKEERIADFVNQIKNPYLFKCGKYTVKASFSENGQTLEECIKGLIK